MSRHGAFAGFRGLRVVWQEKQAPGAVHRHADGARGHGRPVDIARGAPDARDSGQMPREAEETAICWLQPRSAPMRRRQYLWGRDGKLASGARLPAAQAVGLLFGSCWTHRCLGSCSLPPSLTCSVTVFAAAVMPVSGRVAAVSRAEKTNVQDPSRWMG